MEELANLIACGETCLGSGSTKSPEFKSFARKFNNRFKKALASIGATDYKASVGHFYISGFFTVKEQAYYFSIQDVRHCFTTDILVRTAKDYKDFTGGMNNYVPMTSDVAEDIKRTFKL